MGRTVNGATSPDTPQRRNSIVKHVFRHDKSSFGYLHGPKYWNRLDGYRNGLDGSIILWLWNLQ